LTSVLDRGECPASRTGRALAPGKGLPVPTRQEADWAPELVWARWLEEKFFASAGDRTPVFQSVARLYSLSYPSSFSFKTRQQLGRNGFSVGFVFDCETERNPFRRPWSRIFQGVRGMGEAFSSRIVTADETWLHHFEPEPKEQDKEWCPQGTHALVSHWHKAVAVDGDFVGK
jgi:hypothetical protein